MANFKSFTLTIVCAFMLDLFGLTLAYNKIYVKFPASIQRALNQAKFGDTIIVGAGNYSEQISITTDGITLQGENATINPPSVPVTNPCTGLAGPATQAGICIAGSGIAYINQFFNGKHKTVQSVAKPVKNVTVSGFTVNGFSGLNIGVLGAVNASVENNTVRAGSKYGILTIGSKDSKIWKNTVLPGGLIGICMDDKSTAEVARNNISGFRIGLCDQTWRAYVHNNILRNRDHGNREHGNKGHDNTDHNNTVHNDTDHGNRDHNGTVHNNTAHNDTDHGDTDHGGKDHSNTAYNDTYHGNKDHGNRDHGNRGLDNRDHGNRDHGNWDHGNRDHGNWDHNNTAHNDTDHGNKNHNNTAQNDTNHGDMDHDSRVGGSVYLNVSSASPHDDTFKNASKACNPTFGIRGVIICGDRNTTRTGDKPRVWGWLGKVLHW